MVDATDYPAVQALHTLPRVTNLRQARQDSIQIMAEAQQLQLTPSVVLDTLEPLSARSTELLTRASDSIDPCYLAKLHDVLVTGHRNMLTLDGNFLADLWNQAGLHDGPPGLVTDPSGRQVLRVEEGIPELIDETAGFLFFHSASGDNHSHWLLQTLPQLLLWEKAGVKPKKIVVQPNIRPYQREILAVLGYDEQSLILRSPDRPIIFRELYVGYVNGTIMPDLTLYDRLRAHYGRAKAGPDKIYVSRQDARSIRRLINEDALIDRMRSLGFTIITPSTMTAAEEVTLFRTARIVCGPLGAGLYNAIFTDPGATIVALSDPNHIMGWMAQSATLRQHRLNWILGLSFDSPEATYTNTHNNWLCDPDRVARAVEGIEGK